MKAKRHSLPADRRWPLSPSQVYDALDQAVSRTRRGSDGLASIDHSICRLGSGPAMVGPNSLRP
jgi:hypothetical protein